MLVNKVATATLKYQLNWVMVMASSIERRSSDIEGGHSGSPRNCCIKSSPSDPSLHAPNAIGMGDDASIK